MKQPRNHTKTGILKAIGVFIALLSVVFLLAPFTMIFQIAFGPVALFGYSFYYVFLPLSLITGVVLSIKGKLGAILGKRFYLGALLVVLGTAFAFGYAGRSAMGSGASYEALLESYSNSFRKADGLFIVNAENASGLAYFGLVDALCKVNEALTITICIVFVLGGLIVAFLRPLTALVGMISLRIGNANAKRASEKEIERRTEEYKKTFQTEDNIARNAYVDPFGASSLKQPIQEEVPAYERPLPSRFVANHEHPRSEIEIPRESAFVPQQPANIPQNKMVKSGLRTAVFTFADEQEEPQEQKPLNQNPLFNPFAEPEPKPAPTIVEEEPKPAPVIVEEEPKPAPVIVEPAIVVEEKVIEEPLEEPKEEPMFIEEPIYEEAEIEETQDDYQENENTIDDLIGEEEPMFIEDPIDPIIEEPAPAPVPQPVPAPAPAPAPAPVPELTAEEKTLRELHQEMAKPLPPYVFPSLDLLKVYENDQNEELIKQGCDANVIRINKAFENLKVGAHVVDYTVGPSVTRYNIQTDDDVSVTAISKVIKDICIRLGGQAVRFEEIVRGQDYSGLEIPNDKSKIISLKEMMSGMSQDPKDNMMIPFGVSISGECVCSDLSKFPHMMVAGTTGSGKSIFMHGLIMSLIMRNRPEDCQIVLIDPKRVEMTKYKDLPHLLCPIIKEPSEAKVCMDKLIEEMDRRYRLFEFAGCRDIRSFNSGYAERKGVKKLPFIVVFIDEYADLVDTCKNIGEPVVRIAQKARAAGIHLVIATQRPSVQVITGVIKANIPVRVALSMSSATDSITIINQGGAEDLVGHGDMLIDCSLIARVGFTRAQGCLVLDDEIERVVEFIKSQGLGTMYNDNFLDLVDHEEEARIAEANAPQIDAAAMKAQSNNDFYETVKQTIMTQEYTSISKIQRTFNVGFPRAGKIFTQLQADGIVAMQPDSPSSAKGCKVLIHMDENADLADIKLGSDN